jgi:hypothetical protein
LRGEATLQSRVGRKVPGQMLDAAAGCVRAREAGSFVDY